MPDEDLHGWQACNYQGKIAFEVRADEIYTVGGIFPPLFRVCFDPGKNNQTPDAD